MLVENITIKRVGEARTGISKLTGNKWANRDVLLEWEDETGKSYISAIADEDIWKQLGYEDGDVATLNLRFRTQIRASGFVVNDIRIINPNNQQES